MQVPWKYHLYSLRDLRTIFGPPDAVAGPPYLQTPSERNVGAQEGSGFSLGPVLVLAAWASFWHFLPRVPGAPPWMAASWLPGLALVLAALAAPSRLKPLATSVPFAVLQIALLAAVLAAGGPGGPLGGPALAALLWLLAASTLAVAWQRRPRDWARVGFFLVHAAPAPLLGGLLSGSRALVALGVGMLALGGPWMFYLKPLLKAPKGGAPVPAWQRWTLQATRALFLAAGAGFLAALSRAPGAPRWNLLAAGLVLAVALHLHHAKGWKGRRAQAAGIAAWGLGLALLLAPWPGR